MRTPLTILAFGFGASLAMGLLMQHLLRVSQERNQPPILVEINRVYGPRLDCDAKLHYVRQPGGRSAELTIRPLILGTARDLARDVGAFFWRAGADESLVSLVVVCEDPLNDTRERIAVPPPALRAGTPLPSSGPATGQAAAPASARPNGLPAAATPARPEANPAAAPRR